MKEQEKPIFERRTLVITIAVIIFVIALIGALVVGIKSRHDRNAAKVDEVVFTASTETIHIEVPEASSEALSTSVSDETIPEQYIPVSDGWTYDEDLTPEENILIYLTGYLGYSDAASCGIIANIAYETGWKFDPDAGNPKRCYGLIQWLGGRLRNLKSWCEENGRDYSTIQGQLDFMDWELQNDDPYGTYECLMDCENDADGAYEAGRYFCYWYERPNNKKEASKWRGNEARKYFNKLVMGAD